MATAHVDLSALRHNLELLASRLRPGCRILAAVKAQGYGHGAVAVARALAARGVEWFGVATPGEALELREGGIDGRILLLGPASSNIPQLAEARIDFTVVDSHSLAALRSSRVSEARVHLKVDTGMGRLGEPPGAALDLAREISAAKGLQLEAVWTHFACADDLERSFTDQQIERFEWLQRQLERESLLPPLLHACNSAGLLGYPGAHYDLVRPGISLYGYSPGELAAPGLRPVMTVTAPVTFVKRVREGTPLSYGATWRAASDTTIATVRYGYGDGYPRVLGNRAWARLQDRRVAVVGRVCMDQLLLDVGDMTVEPGERVTLFGPLGPTAADLGSLAGTISYELLTSVAPRVTRTYSE